MEILYRDEHLVAVNKPAGLLVHRSDLDRHETRFALQLVRDSLGRHVYPAHRLDRPTSGVLLFALSPGDAEVLGRAFAEGSVAKKYLAVVRGVPPDSGVIDYPLTVVEDRSVSSPGRGKEPRPAVTEFRRLASVEVPGAIPPHATPWSPPPRAPGAGTSSGGTSPISATPSSATPPTERVATTACSATSSTVTAFSSTGRSSLFATRPAGTG